MDDLTVSSQVVVNQGDIIWYFVIYWFIGCIITAWGYAHHLRPQVKSLGMKEKDFEDPNDAFNAQAVFFEILIWPYALILILFLAPTYFRLSTEVKNDKKSQ